MNSPIATCNAPQQSPTLFSFPNFCFRRPQVSVFQIWNIQIYKHGRNSADFDTVQLAQASEGLTGSEIEAVFVESLYDAFDRDTEPTDLDIARVLTTFVPLSRTMAVHTSGE